MEETKSLDLRKVKSQETLKHAFWQLLEHIGYSKINVRNISEEANLNRKTFYRNYPNIETLMLHALSDLIVNVAGPYQHFLGQATVMDGEFEQTTREYILRVQQNKHQFRLIFQNQLEASALKIWKSIYCYTTTHYPLLGPNVTTIPETDIAFPLLTNYLSYSAFAHLEWLVRYADDDTDTLVRKSMESYASYLHAFYIFYGLSSHVPVPDITHTSPT